MNEFEYKILVHLKNHHRGSENAITFKNLSVELRINSRDLRSAVSDLVTRGEGCVCTDSINGYYYPLSYDEYFHCYKELRKRGLSDLKRARGLMKAWYKYEGKIEQQRLFAEVM